MAVIYAYGTTTITVPAAGSIAVYTTGSADVFLQVGYPNAPSTFSQLASVSKRYMALTPLAR